MSIEPRTGTATERRDCRRELRRLLGVSSDPPPPLRCLFKAAQQLDRLLLLTTNGEYSLLVSRTRDEVTIEPRFLFQELPQNGGVREE